MEYHGKLYGKVGGEYFDTGSTSQDIGALHQKIDELAEQVLKLNLANVTQHRELLIAFLKKFKKTDKLTIANKAFINVFLKRNL